MEVAEFVDKIKEILPVEFPAICNLAKEGKMGWGEHSNDWGTKDGRG